jgi:excisionase family DNA binding protein
MTQQSQSDEWLSVDDVARILNMNEETVRKWIRRKELRAYKFGRDYRIRRDDFDKFVQDRVTDGDE